MDVISRTHRKAYMKIARSPLYENNQSQEVQQARRFQRMLLQKNFTTLDMSLKGSFLEEQLNRPIQSAHICRIQDLGQYKSLIRTRSAITASYASCLGPVYEGKPSRPQLKSPSNYKLFISKDDGQIMHLVPHVTMGTLCNTLKEKGLGDPRVQLQRRTRKNPLPLLKKLKSQQEKYPFYLEKLRGKASMDMDNVNSRAVAFIEQQKDSGAMRTASAHWRERYQRLNEGGGHSDDSLLDDDVDEFAAWDEDSKPRTLDEETVLRINSWITDVEQALQIGTGESS